jgi:hypothetical protein
MDLFTTGQALEVTGMAANTFDRWIGEGIIEPVKPGEGTGNYRQFSRMQLLGISYGWARRQDPQYPACLRAVGDYIERIGEMDEAEMLAAFRRKRTHLSPFPPFDLMKPWPGSSPTEFNLKIVYERVTKTMDAIARRPVKVGRGHRVSMETATR